MTTAPEEVIDLLAVDRALRNNTPLTDLELPEKRYAAQLLTADGHSAHDIAERLGVAQRTIVRWRGRPAIAVPDEPTEVGDWATDALCRQFDASLFFPPDDEDDRVGNGNPIFYNEARAVCIRCPVRHQCLEDAMAREGNTSRGNRAGVWGGLSPGQRAALAAVRRKEVTA